MGRRRKKKKAKKRQNPKKQLHEEKDNWRQAFGILGLLVIVPSLLIGLWYGFQHYYALPKVLRGTMIIVALILVFVAFSYVLGCLGFFEESAKSPFEYEYEDYGAGNGG